MGAVEWMPQRHLGVEPIAVAAAFAFSFEVAGVFELGDDALCGTFGDPHLRRDVANAHVGVLGDAQQDVCVIRQEGPLSHLQMLAQHPRVIPHL